MVMKLNSNTPIAIIAAYAPTAPSTTDKKEHFYNKLTVNVVGRGCLISLFVFVRKF